MSNPNRLKQKINTYVSIVEQIGTLSTSSNLLVGSIAVRKDLTKIAAFGYNGNYPNAAINPDTLTEEESLESGKSGYIHAEENLLIKFHESDPENYIILITHSPCRQCAKRLVIGGFRHVYWKNQYREFKHIPEIFGRSDICYGDINDLIAHYPIILKNFKK